MIEKYEKYVPDIDPSCYISENATIIGNVTIQSNSSVWFGAVIRGDRNQIYIGKNTNIQDNCTIHISGDKPTRIGDDVTIGHNAVVHACTVGDRVLIGIGAVILDGAVIGDDVIIGAGSVVPPNKVIPPNSLVMGVPAKIIRNLDQEDKTGIKISAARYVELAQIYKQK